MTGRQDIQVLCGWLTKQPKHEALTLLVLLLISVICCNKVRLGYVCMYPATPPGNTFIGHKHTHTHPTWVSTFLWDKIFSTFSSVGFKYREVLDCVLIYNDISLVLIIR